MNVLQLISSGGYYGAESVVITLTHGLAELGCRTVIGVFQNQHRPHTEVAEAGKQRGLVVEMIQCQGRLDWATVRAIRNCIYRHHIDIVHTHGYKADIYGYLAARSLGTPLVATSHFWTRGTVPLRLFEFLDRIILKRFKMIVTVSDDGARTLLRVGVPREQIKTIDNGIDLSAFEDASPTLAMEIGKGERVLVGAVGRLVVQKGFETFLTAARKVLDDFPTTLFVIVGEGPERSRLETLARDLELDDNVIFAGRWEDMAGVYASLDLFVLPSIGEGLPMALLEALASRKAVIATRVAAVPRVVIPGETGCLVEPRDSEGLRSAMVQLLAAPELRRRLGENGHAWVKQHFASGVMARKYLDLYESVLAERDVKAAQRGKACELGNDNQQRAERGVYS